MHFFKLRKLGKSCDCCKEPLVKKAYSTLQEGKEVLRRDLCHNCYLTEKPALWWQSIIEDKKAKPIYMTPYDKRLWDLFVGTSEDYRLHFLANYFKRRKLFLSQGECEKEGKSYEILESKETREVFFIPKVVPSTDSMQGLLDELSAT